MLAELNQITSIISNICFIAIVIWFVKKYIQAKKYFYQYMDIDKILNQAEGSSVPQDNKAKERLIQVVASGKSKQYFGKHYSTEEIEKLDVKEIAKLYARYEAVLGGLITAQLKNHMIYAYTRAVEFICPTVSKGRFAVQNLNQMQQSLNNGPFIDLALTSLTCKMYHEYGHFLAPIEAALLTSNFVHPASYQLATQQATQQAAQQNQQNVQQNLTSSTTNLASYQHANQQTTQQQQMMQQRAMQQTTQQQQMMQQRAMQQIPTKKPS